MSKVTLYIAQSLDGYIARKDGSVDWLDQYNEGECDGDYPAFYNSIDTLIMGSKTYEKVLEFGSWVYEGKQTYVCTQRDLKSEHEDITFISSDIKALVQKLEGKTIWLVGGGQLLASFMQLNLVNEFIITICPLVLGEGLPLFVTPLAQEKLILCESRIYQEGMVQLHYKSVK